MYYNLFPNIKASEHKIIALLDCYSTSAKLACIVNREMSYSEGSKRPTN